MKPIELRIGNLINDNAEVIGIVKGGIYVKPVGKHEITSYRHDQLKSIPLTEEWLKKFGFVKSSQDERMWIDDNTGWFMIYEKDGYYKFSTSESVYGKQFNKVHQFQNLYFTLTGEELIINHGK